MLCGLLFPLWVAVGVELSWARPRRQQGCECPSQACIACDSTCCTELSPYRGCILTREERALCSPSAAPQGRGVFAAPGGVRSPLLIDCSTIDPGTARVVAASAQGAPLHADVASLTRFRAPLMMDAPVSGGVAGAAAGTLTFMVPSRLTCAAAATPQQSTSE